MQFDLTETSKINPYVQFSVFSNDRLSLICLNEDLRMDQLSLLGDSRKYPYHTTGGILEFRGRGGISWTGIPKTWEGNAVWNSKGMGGGGGGGFQL